jgi:RimJ/RimL family protein N-acetyltransferase
MVEVIIHTLRLHIKKIGLEDALDMFEYRSNGAVSKHQSFKPKTIDSVKIFLEKNTKEFNIQDKWFQFGVYLNSKMIGDIGIHFIGPENMQCEIGYTISHQYQRNGYGKESVNGVVNYLFKEMNKHRIVASLNPKNKASIELLKSLGFRREGLFRKSILSNGNWEDDLIYALLREEWEQKKVG